jgi:hypothetical protein
MFLLNRIDVEKDNKKSCASQINSQHAKEVASNRKYIIHVKKIIHFLANKVKLFVVIMKIKIKVKILETLWNCFNSINPLYQILSFILKVPFNIQLLKYKTKLSI